ncbi:MAG TPA: hypothetical protein VHC47_10380 [Mucilaginibacter sp.]|nr:hypothetical protein [Mucilaginibacter sp.]
MKKIIILALALIAGHSSFAQQKTSHMTITLYNAHVTFSVGHKPDNMIITRDDTAQVQRLVDLVPHVKLRDQPAAYEKIVMQLLKPYYDDGWKLVASNAEFIESTNTEIFRYYFTREQ